MLKAYHTNEGHELAVTWLFALYKQQTGGNKGGGTAAGEGAQEAVREDSNQGGRASVKAEEGSAAASRLTDAEGQVEEVEGQQSATAMEVDGLGGNSRALCSAEA